MIEPPADLELERVADAAVEVVDCIRVLEKSGSNLVAEALGGRRFIEYDHYPPDDVYDSESRAQYYFHAHPQNRGPWNDYGHFHTFLRVAGMPPGVQPFPAPSSPIDPAADNALCHLIAISMNREGRPVRLFTTNRWVTAETWYRADDVIAMLDRFAIDLSRPSWPLNRWISAMIVLFRQDIEFLIRRRDETVDLWRQEHPESDVFEDRNLEIASASDIDLDDRLGQVRSRLGLDRELHLPS
ncbi:MAG: hypothetical protein KGJ79_16540 [Alphaproteobacteria bacterium]|nr:hypothetical protein [Alphaproteobacteria bacterium]MDE2112750.1 hypothetical protein [Alphaproteobacteria bacterium]MDE2495715.1 hypothetical protein [Alphaproteobacteria bacterium]